MKYLDLNSLGNKYYFGEDGEIQDYAKAMFYFQQAANLGDAFGKILGFENNFKFYGDLMDFLRK